MLRLELRPWNIESVLIVPGAVKTQIWKSLENWDEEIARFPTEAENLYGALSSAMLQAGARLSAQGISPDRVARVVERSLVTRRPQTEVVVGPDAKFMMGPIGKLPARIKEAVVSKVFALPGRDSPG